LPWASLALLVLLAGCVNRVHEPMDYSRAAFYTMPVSNQVGVFDYSAPTPSPEFYAMPTRQADGYHVHGIRFPSSESNGQPGNMVEARYFESTSGTAAPKPLLIVLPIWATHTFPSTVIANGYARRSQGEANILWLQGDEALFDWFKLADMPSEAAFEREVDLSVERFRSVAVDIRRLIDWAETRPEIDSNRIAIIGFSMSAMVAANVAGNDPRVSAAVYVLGGARPWDVMTYCRVVVGYMRKGVMNSFGWSTEEFREFFRQKLAFGDPALWRGHYRPEGTLIIESSKDDCMPPESRDALWQATGQPERIIFPYNHWQPFLAMTPVGVNVLTEDIFEFLDRKLLPGRAGAGPGQGGTAAAVYSSLP
jgi:hypothetical protein